MSNSILVHTQGVQGFDFLHWDWGNGRAVASITRQKRHFKCASCKSGRVTATPVGERLVQGLPMGRSLFYLQVRMHRLRCHDCGAYRMEELPFLSGDHNRITRQLERSLVELREHMSIKAVAAYYQVDWKTVKRAEKQALKRRYRRIPLAKVQIIGIDEIYVGHKQFKTIVRDLEQGHVLHVGDGKGAAALEAFQRRLASSKAQIKAVAMDMSSGYASWVNEHLPEAEIVFDHFHVIQLMNKKVDQVRRRTMATLEGEEKQALKKSATYS